MALLLSHAAKWSSRVATTSVAIAMAEGVSKQVRRMITGGGTG
jgi:hypothetical protein